MILLISNCASKTITFSANTKAELSLVSIGSTGGNGKIIGELPQTIEVATLEKNIMKVSAEDHVPQYWLVKDVVAENTNITLVLEKQIQKPEEKKDDKKDDNKPANSKNISARLLLKSYGALVKGQFDIAKELAKKLEAIEPDLAAPHLLQGLALIRQGNNSEAKIAFEKASALDPDDSEIKKLIDVAN